MLSDARLIEIEQYFGNGPYRPFVRELLDEIIALRNVAKLSDYYSANTGHADRCPSNSTGENNDCLCGYTDTCEALTQWRDGKDGGGK